MENLNAEDDKERIAKQEQATADLRQRSIDAQAAHQQLSLGNREVLDLAVLFGMTVSDNAYEIVAKYKVASETPFYVNPDSIVTITSDELRHKVAGWASVTLFGVAILARGEAIDKVSGVNHV